VPNLVYFKQAVKVMWSVLTVGAIALLIVIIWEIAVPARLKDKAMSRIEKGIFGIKEGFSSTYGRAYPSYGNYQNEGFSSSMVNASESDAGFLGAIFPARGDIGDNMEEKGYQQDPRYFHGYTDVQSLKLNKDYCRMVVPVKAASKKEDPLESFFACALAGTEGLSSVKFRTPSIKQGFRCSRDDYMRDIGKDGRNAYCSIVKVNSNSFDSRCYRAFDTEFGTTQYKDSAPPENIKTLLEFYDGIFGWLRMRDDILDYAKNLHLMSAGDITIDEAPNPVITKGLHFNGANQFLRIGENTDLVFESKISLRFMRAVSVWVYFDEFTNNARIFDFGMGASNNNILLGIIGRGDGTASSGNLGRSSLICGEEDKKTIPDRPSGAQPCPEMSPQKLMKTSAANVDDFVCPLPSVVARNLDPLQLTASDGQSATASLIYEVWEGRRRAMTIKVPGVIPIAKWTHIAVTSLSDDTSKPDIGVYINGELKYVKTAGSLPQTSYTDTNYIGKSNWTNDTSLSDNKDELFKGSMFDFRMYNKYMAKSKIKNTYKWGSQMLGVPLATNEE